MILKPLQHPDMRQAQRTAAFQRNADLRSRCPRLNLRSWRWILRPRLRRSGRWRFLVLRCLRPRGHRYVAECNESRDDPAEKNRRESFEDPWLFIEEVSQDSFCVAFYYGTESVTQFRGSSKPFDSRVL